MTLLKDNAVTSSARAEILNVMFVLMCHACAKEAMINESSCCSDLLLLFQTSSERPLKAKVLRLLTILAKGSSLGRASILAKLENYASSQGESRLFASEFDETIDDGTEMTMALVTFLHEIVLAAANQSLLTAELRDAGAVSFLERASSAVTDPMLTVRAKEVLQILTHDTSKDHAQPIEKSPSTPKIVEDTEGTSYQVDLTEAHSVSPGNKTVNSVDMRSASKFKLHLPGTNVFNFGIDKKTEEKSSASPQTGPKETSSLSSVLSQLQQHSQQLDHETNARLTGLLAQLSASLVDAKATMAKGVVDLLEQSLARQRQNRSPQKSSASASMNTTAVSPPSSESADAGHKRVKFALFARNGVEPIEKNEEPKGMISHADSDRTSSAETESVEGSPIEDSGESRRRSNMKLSLPLFQSFRKGPGLGVTPACTPIATASVRKDAKRHSFPSQTAPSLFVLEEVSRAVVRSPLALPPISIPDPVETRTAISEDALLPAPAATPSNDLSRYRKLLAMGAPKDAVRAKMQQAGVDPNLLDEEPQGFTPSPRSSKTNTSTTAAEAAPSVVSVNISKFKKLLDMGAPMAAVKAKMMQAGVDPNLLELKQTGFSAPTAAATPVDTPVAVQHSVVPDSSDLDVSKFKKLLSMGAPLAAVKAKMVQAGIDPSLLDNAPPPVSSAAPTTSQAAPETAQVAAVLVKDAPEYAKFFKLLSMGAPTAAVKAKMTQAGLNPDLLDTPDAAMASTSAVSAATTSDSSPPLKVKDHPDYAKFFKLLSMGAPTESVKAKIRMAGLNPDLLDTPDENMPIPKAVPAAEPPVKVKDDPNYVKFFKLLSMGAPAESVKAKMRMAGLNPDLLDTPEAMVAPPTVEATPPVKVKDDPEYAKFFKLLAMNAPAESVKAKMRMAGLNPDLLDTPDASVPSKSAAAAASPPVMVKDDPEYAKFFKLLAMNAPTESVKAKMRMAGLNADLLDTPEAILPPKGGAIRDAPAAGNAPSSRRAHLALSIPPPVKQTTRPFYWQQLKGETIKGTIWEEIDREGCNQNNDAPLLLSDSDLSVLESEFPPPNKDGPVTGGRQRSGSLDLGPMSPGPASPLASPRVVFLIDRSRANNISIIVKQFRVSNSALREAIMKVDVNVLNLERVQGLIKILPTEEEIAAIAAFQGDPTTLNDAERVLKELMTVPRLKQRLSSLLATLQFPGQVRDLEEKIAKVRNASSEIANSAEFKSVLQVILQVGNKMNMGTNRGNAKGFRLGDLTKLAQLKSVDRSVTLLHYVARMIRQKKGNIVHLGDSLSSLYDVQNVPIPELQGDMNKVSEVVDTISAELTAQQLKNSIEEKEACDAFVPAMTSFLETATTTTAVLKDSLEKAMLLLQSTMRRFDKDPDDDSTSNVTAEASGMPSPTVIAGAGEFFNIVYEFSVALSKADRDNEMKRLREEKRLKQQIQKSQIPLRSHSSVDLLGCRRGFKAETEAGPETPEVSKDAGKQGADTIECSPRPAHSASMSAIIGSKLTATVGDSAPPQSPLAAAKMSVSKMMNSSVKPDTTSTEKIKTLDSSSAKKSQTPVGIGKPPQHMKSPVSAKLAETQEPQSTRQTKKGMLKKGSPKAVLSTPGKIVKSSKHMATMSPLKNFVSGSSNVVSPLKIVPPSSVEKNRTKPLSVERVVPFDGSSVEEIRSSLETKHGARSSPMGKTRRSSHDSNDNNRKSSSPEENSSEVDITSTNLTLELET